MVIMDYIFLGIGGIFVLSVAIVLLTSWLAGRGSRYRSRRARTQVEDDFYVPSPRPKPKPVVSGENPGMQADIVKEIMETEIPESPIKKPVSQPTATESTPHAILDEFEDIDIGDLEEDIEEKSVEFDIEDDFETIDKEDLKEHEHEEEDMEIFEDLEEAPAEEFIQEIERPLESEPIEPLEEELDDELDFLYEEEEEKKEVEEITETEEPEKEPATTSEEKEYSHPDCFGNPEIYSQCSKSCGIGEECRKAFE